MEDINQNTGSNSGENNNDNWDQKRWERNHRASKIFAGIAIVTAGALLLVKRTGGDVPSWLLSWPMLLIVIGIGSGIKHSFRRPGAYVLLALGGIFLAEYFITGVALKPFIWPVAIMLVGLFIIFKPRRSYRSWQRHQWKRERCQRFYHEKKNGAGNEDYLEVNSVFGGVKKNIISKNFKGGEINAVFGGAEINLSQADIEGTVEMELNQVFGSTKLIVPSNWEIKSELNVVLGGIEDKRQPISNAGLGENKILMLRGSCVFGGIEITSYS